MVRQLALSENDFVPRGVHRGTVRSNDAATCSEGRILGLRRLPDRCAGLQIQAVHFAGSRGEDAGAVLHRDEDVVDVVLRVEGPHEGAVRRAHGDQPLVVLAELAVVHLPRGWSDDNPVSGGHGPGISCNGRRYARGPLRHTRLHVQCKGLSGRGHVEELAVHDGRDARQLGAGPALVRPDHLAVGTELVDRALADGGEIDVELVVNERRRTDQAREAGELLHHEGDVLAEVVEGLRRLEAPCRARLQDLGGDGAGLAGAKGVAVLAGPGIDRPRGLGSDVLLPV
mmetsp:Transcript_97079/g.302199  ORF Transcript_97079/g.302199 Transcript_97079/m.302199 type:complete len:285 (+) Transcript_97079:736-1590(+)